MAFYGKKLLVKNDSTFIFGYNVQAHPNRGFKLKKRNKQKAIHKIFKRM